ncbi:hypothetical protein VULLAG_LOCUS684 [Vulpes lagopus]
MKAVTTFLLSLGAIPSTLEFAPSRDFPARTPECHLLSLSLPPTLAAADRGKLGPPGETEEDFHKANRNAPTTFSTLCFMWSSTSSSRMKQVTQISAN